MVNSPSIVGLIPARAGSKRVPGKNAKLLAGHPMMAYAISSAIDSGIFRQVIGLVKVFELTGLIHYVSRI